MERTLLVYVDGIPTFNIISANLNELKNYFIKNYPNHIVKIDNDDWEKIKEIHLIFRFNEEDIPKTQCIKVAALRKVYDNDINLKKWINMPNNLYVGRRGRIFIDGVIFHYPDSKWGNPFLLKDYSLKDSLELYKKHVLESDLKNRLIELKGKTLGCFCDQSGGCHAKVLVELYRSKVK